MTLEEIESKIKYAEDNKKTTRELAEDEDDKDYRKGYYEQIDKINNYLDKLYIERNRLRESGMK